MHGETVKFAKCSVISYNDFDVAGWSDIFTRSECSYASTS